MEKFATRPLTASSKLARLNSAASHASGQAGGQHTQHVQMKEFGDKQRQTNGFNMSFHSPARPASANPVIGRPGLIYSTINKDLKLELKKHVPLYKHREMGKIMYKETSSKIIRPKTASSSYNGLLKQPATHKFFKTEDGTLRRPQSASNRARPITITGAEVHVKPEYLGNRVFAEQGKNASIMGVDFSRDHQLQAALPSFFVCRPYGSSPRSNYGSRHFQAKRNLEILDQLDTELHHTDTTPMARWRKRSNFTVFDSVKRQVASDYYRPKKVIFENDPNFVTLAKVTN